MINRLRDSIHVCILMVSLAMAVIIMLAFYWDFGFQDIHVKSIPTEGGNFVDVMVNAEFFLVLTTVALFYIGYRVATSRKPEERVESIATENRNEIILQHLFAVILGAVGLWLIFSVFSRTYIWHYYTPHYVQITREATISGTNIPLSLALTTIGLLLLVNFIIVKVLFAYRKRGRNE